MITQNTLTKDEKKRLQNKQDYQRRKSSLRFRIRRFLFVLAEILMPNKLRMLCLNWAKKFNSAEKISVLTVILLITTFSVRDTVTFLSSSEGDALSVWLKAISTEGIVLIFSWITFRSIPLKFLKVLTLISVFIYSFYTTSGTGLFSASHSLRETSLIEEEISDIRHEILSKKEARASYLRTDRLTAVRQVDKRIDELQDRLSALRSKASHATSASVIQIDSAMKTLFRITALLANILLTHYLALLFEASKTTSERVGKKKSRTAAFETRRKQNIGDSGVHLPNFASLKKDTQRLYLVPQD